MNTPPDIHAASAETLTDAVAGFCRFVRRHGFNVGVQETLDALRTARLGTLTDRRVFRPALRALLCTGKEDHDQFDGLFEQYWRSVSMPGRPARKKRAAQPVTRTRQGIPLLMIGTGNEAVIDDEEGKSTSGASTVERLRKTDFSKVPLHDQERLEQLALRLCKQMSLRLSRRLKTASRRRQVDLRRTIRRSLAHGGTPLDLRFRGRKQHKPRLAILLDVSGSMDQYSFFLLRFIYALQHHFDRVDSFLFSTRLRCINDVMKARRLPETLSALADTSEAWSSGTRIGACLETFNEVYSRRVLSKNTLVLILSDGLDTGEPDLLAREIQTIRERAKKLIWLNPLLGMDGYQPLTRGIQTVLPHVDACLAAHNLESLLTLETHLRYV